MPINTSLGAAQPLPGPERRLAPEIAPLDGNPAGQSGSASRAVGRPFEFAPNADRLNHNVFRYPAKFHPPVARQLIEDFSRPGDRVLDPFCGSGTTLVEALVSNRSAIGTDIDPLAVFVSSAKVHRYGIDALGTAIEAIGERVIALRAEDEARWGTFLDDAPADEMHNLLATERITVPTIPRMKHWFRDRVVWQLGSLRNLVREQSDDDVKLFLTLCFASIIRGSSNADPVPVSGLEVTSHMLRKEVAGRIIDPYALFMRAMTRILRATSDFAKARSADAAASVSIGDARDLATNYIGEVDVAVTSPPYLTAVDYYRRHTLEMYWLDLVSSQDDRLSIMPTYIGRDRVGARHLPDPGVAHASALSDRWLERFPALKAERARAFRHYCDGMSRALSRMGQLVRPGGNVVVVAGDVTFGGRPVSMLELMTDLATPDLELVDHLWYAIKNRYMSYTRKNEANIAADRVIVFRRR